MPFEGTTASVTGGASGLGLAITEGLPPGMVVTPMLEKAIAERFTDSFEHFAAITPVRRAGRPDDIDNAVIFLCSDESPYITGQITPVNGGRRT